MRISTSWAQQLGVNAMNAQQAKMAKTQLQLSTGLKALSPSDDPVGSVKAIGIQTSIDQTGQYQDNLAVVRSRLNLEEGSLSAGENILFRVKELTVQALNSTLTANDKLAIKSEIDQLIEQMVGVANTKNSNGEYIYAGDLSTTPPVVWSADVESYVYQGGTHQRVLDIAAERKIADSDLATEVFFNLNSVSQEANATVNGVESNQRSVFDTLQALSKSLASEYQVQEAVITGDRFVRFGMDYSTPVTVPATPSLTTTFDLTSDTGRTLSGSSPLSYPLDYSISNAAFDVIADGVNFATITLASNYANQVELVNDIQSQISASPLDGLVEVDLSANPLEFISTSTSDSPTLSVFQSASVVLPPSSNDFLSTVNFSTPRQSGTTSLTATTPALTFPLTLTNTVFDMTVDGNSETISLSATYTTLADLQTDFQTQISGTSLDGLVELNNLANPLQFDYLGAAASPVMEIAQNSAAFPVTDFLADAGFSNGQIVQPVTVTLDSEYQDLQAVADAINATPGLTALNIVARPNGNQLEFVSTTEGDKSSITLYEGTGTFLTDFGFSTGDHGVGANLGGSITGSQLSGFLNYEDSPASFELLDGAGNSQLILLQTNYSDHAALITDIQSQIVGSSIDGKIEIDPAANPITFNSISSGTAAVVQINQVAGNFLNENGFIDGDAGRVFNQTANDALADLDTTLDNFLAIRTTVGARLRALDDQESQNEKFVLDMRTTLSDIQDLDYADAISRFTIEQSSLQAAQQAFSRVQNLSLFNFL